MNIIETTRLTLRRLALTDADFIMELLNQQSFLTHIGDKGVRNLARAREYIATGPMESYRRYGFGLFLTSLREGGAPIGICGLVKRETLVDVDIGFALLPRYESRGYATEAAAAVLEYGRCVCGLRRIVAIAAPDNRGSIAVIEKIGLRFERPIRLDEDGRELNLFAADSPPR